MNQRGFRRAGRERGYTLTELVVVMALLGILAAMSAVAYTSYANAAALRWGATEVQSGLNRAKMLALSTRQNVCVEVAGAGAAYRFRRPDCGLASVVWTGVGTDGNGWMRASTNVTVTNGGAAPIFTPFGTASQAGTVTVTGVQGAPLTVTVNASGRVTIP